MLVTKVTGGGSSFTVTRCDGKTCDPNNTSTIPSHEINSPVMSTLLPNLAKDYTGKAYNFTASQVTAGYQLGLQAQVCHLSHEGPLTNGSETYYSFTYFDIGDSWMDE